MDTSGEYYPPLCLLGMASETRFSDGHVNLREGERKKLQCEWMIAKRTAAFSLDSLLCVSHFLAPDDAVFAFITHMCYVLQTFFHG